MFARIAGVGSYLPGQPVSNLDLGARCADIDDEWIITRTGIRTRHLAKAEDTSSDLALEASRRALASAGVDASELDLIIVATSTPDFIFPSTACLLQAKIGNHGAMAFDIQAVCAGFSYALSIAEKFIRSGSHKKALVVGAEVFSRILDWSDRSTCVLFGDGAGAVVVEAAEKPGILATAMHADGSHNGILSVPGSISGGQVTGDPFLRMDGPAVFKFAVRVLSEVAIECCEAAEISPNSIDWLIPHQANIRIIQSAAKHFKMPMDKVWVNIDKYSNTSAACIPIALTEMQDQHAMKKGDNLLLVAFGAGLTWGAALLEW